jgi:MinD superfamily P-loop ATPase
MKIAVLSGKGGTGKTLVSVNLASFIGLKSDSSTQKVQTVIYADCDVEEPNGHLFFKPQAKSETQVTVLVPKFDNEKCISCRACVEFCKFNALAMIKKPMLFPEICHSCGGCAKVCPTGAITEVEKNVGNVKYGTSIPQNTNGKGSVTVLTGTMNPGETSGTPIIDEIYKEIDKQLKDKPDSIVVIDCPPGSACLTMDAIKDADFCVLVAEPTVFGTHNFAMVYELVKLFKKPFGAVLNKTPRKDGNVDGVDGENPSKDFCLEHAIPVLTEIPFSHELGELNSNGKIIVREKNKYIKLFKDLDDQIVEQYLVQTTNKPVSAAISRNGGQK